MPLSEGLAMTTSEFTTSFPPTPAEWAAMADTSARTAFGLRHRERPLLALARGPAKEMANVAAMLGQAAEFHRAFAELCETAEKRLIDASL
jgi:hypothetical protein